MKPTTAQFFPLLCVMLLLTAAGCVRVNLGTEEGKPIHIVHDVNIRLDRQLDEFFAFEQNAATTQPATQSVTTTQPAPAPLTQPATTPTAARS